MTEQHRQLILALSLLLACPWGCQGQGGCAAHNPVGTDLGKETSAAAAAPKRQPAPPPARPKAVEGPGVHGGPRAVEGPDEGSGLGCQTGNQRRCVRQLVELMSRYLATGDRGLFSEFNAWVGDENRVPRANEEQRFKQQMLVVLGMLLQGRKPVYPAKEHEIVASFVLPSLKDRTRLKELITVLGPRKAGPGGQMTGDYATAYQQIMGGFFTLKPDLERHLDQSRIVALRPGMKVADIGCGVGSQVTALARRVGATGRVYAVDISPRVVDFVGHLRTWVPGGARIVPVRSRHDDTKLEPKSLDLAMVHGINFLFGGGGKAMPEHAVGFFRSVRRALKPGGLFLVRSYQHTAHLERYIAKQGFEKLKRYNARPQIKGNTNTMIAEDFYVLFRAAATP